MRIAQDAERLLQGSTVRVLDDPSLRNCISARVAHHVHQVPGMYDIDAIEAINVEQLATVTDRLLLRGRVTRRRLSTNKITVRTDAGAVRPELAPDRTLIVRRAHRFPAGLAVVTSLVAIAASLVCML